MTPAVAALIFGGCASEPPGVIGRPFRAVTAAGASVTDCLHGNGYWTCSPPYLRKMDECVTEHTARADAKRVLHATKCGNTRHTCDFANGFEQAFVDIANGGSGQVPAVAPRQYWSRPFRTPEGRAVAQAWFDGYAAGAQQALSRYGDTVIAASASYGEGCYPSAQNCTY
jgi:hypothetical protein